MADATKLFKLAKIRLVSCNFVSERKITNKALDESYTVQTRKWVEPEVIPVGEGEDSPLMLVVRVNLGLRLVDAEKKDSDPNSLEPVYSIEGSFEADFNVLVDSIDQDDFDNFVTKNAAHVVWPYWRQHVASTLQSASLPVVQIPLMAPVSNPPKRIKSAKKIIKLGPDGIGETRASGPSGSDSE